MNNGIYCIIIVKIDAQNYKKTTTMGNSYGIRIAKGETERENIKHNEDLEIIIIKKSNPARDVFETLKGKIKNRLIK